MKKGFTIVIAFSFCIISLAQPGTLDNTFSGDGKVLSKAGFSKSAGKAMAIQPNGKIVVGGQANTWNDLSDFNILRYNTNGTLDNTFGFFGIATVDFGDDDYVDAIAIQTDGKIIAAGTFYNTATGNFDIAIARFNANGSIDNTFNLDGILQINIGSYNDAYAVAVQPDGRIIIAGVVGISNFLGGYNEDFFAIRINQIGFIDNSFGISGIAIISLGGNEAATSMALQPDGKIILAGYRLPYGIPSGDFAIARLNSNGSFDNTFNGNGRKILDFIGTDDGVSGVTLQSNGKIILGGYIESLNGKYDFAVARLNSNGSIDNTFSGDGKATTNFGLDDFGYAVALQADGKIVLAGSTGNFASSSFDGDFAVARYNTDGSPDNTFSLIGRITTSFGGDDNGKALAIQSNGKIVVAGFSGANNFAVARYNGGNAFAKDKAAEKSEKNIFPSLSLYPNPATNIIYIKGLNPLAATTISIVDMAGSILQTQIASGNKFTINIQSLKAGVYNAVITESGKITQLKFIK